MINSSQKDTMQSLVREEITRKVFAISGPLLRDEIELALDKGNNNLIRLWEELGKELEISPGEALHRACACYIWTCCVNLIDDIEDGECSYIPAERQPLVLATMLNALTVLQMSPEAGLDLESVYVSHMDMGEVAAAQRKASRSVPSHARGYFEMARSMGGMQFSAYTHLFCGKNIDEYTRLKIRKSSEVLGTLTFILRDLDDPRFLNMDQDSRLSVVEMAIAESKKHSLRRAPRSMLSKIAWARDLLENTCSEGGRW